MRVKSGGGEIGRERVISRSGEREGGDVSRTMRRVMREIESEGEDSLLQSETTVG